MRILGSRVEPHGLANFRFSLVQRFRLEIETTQCEMNLREFGIEPQRLATFCFCRLELSRVRERAGKAEVNEWRLGSDAQRGPVLDNGFVTLVLVGERIAHRCNQQ